MTGAVDTHELIEGVPACAICMGRGDGPRALYHLPLGISVWLCAAHRNPEWLGTRGGRDVVTSLRTVWRGGERPPPPRPRPPPLVLGGGGGGEQPRRGPRRRPG